MGEEKNNGAVPNGCGYVAMTNILAVPATIFAELFLPMPGTLGKVWVFVLVPQFICVGIMLTAHPPRKAIPRGVGAGILVGVASIAIWEAILFASCRKGW